MSVVVPTHDRETLLERALESVYGQSQPPGEVLVVDDGSTDGTAAMVAGRFPDARLLSQTQSGVSAARNRGIREARGSWIALLDSDDEWLPGKLEAQLEVLRKEPGCRVCHTEEIWIRRGRRINPKRRHAKAGGWIFERCLPLCAISPSSVLVERNVFDEVGFFDESLPACEDYDLWLRLTARHPVAFVEEPQIVKHGGHADQLSRRFPAMDRFRIRALEKLLESGDLSPAQRKAAAEELSRKVSVYAQGASRRGRREEAEALLERAARFRAEAAQS